MALGAWRTSEVDNSGTASGISRSSFNEIQDRSWNGSRVDGLDGATLCMGCEQFPSEVKGTVRTFFRSIRGKDYTGEVVPFGEVCMGRNHSEDGANLNMRWMRGVFVGKRDRTDEFPLLAPTVAMKTRCVRRLEGDNAWDLQFLNLCVGSPWIATARSTQQKPTIQQKGELESSRRAKRVYLRQNILDKYGRAAGCQGCVGNGQHTEECRARVEQEMVDKGDAIKLETSGNQEEIVPESDVSLKKRKIGYPDINPGWASSFNGRHTQEVQNLSTNFFVTRHLSTSAEIALH